MSFSGALILVFVNATGHMNHMVEQSIQAVTDQRPTISIVSGSGGRTKLMASDLPASLSENDIVSIAGEISKRSKCTWNTALKQSGQPTLEFICPRR